MTKNISNKKNSEAKKKRMWKMIKKKKLRNLEFFLCQGNFGYTSQFAQSTAVRHICFKLSLHCTFASITEISNGDYI